jgi:hypothetical protein
MTTRLVFSLVLALSLLSPVGAKGRADDSATSSSDSGKLKLLDVRTDNKTDLDEVETDFQAFKAATTDAAKLAAAQKWGKKVITVRIKVLTSLATKLADRKCTEADKTLIASSVATETATLTKAQTDLAAATTADQAKQIVKTAIDSTHVFGVLVPASRGLCITSRTIGLIDGKLATIVAQLETAKLDTTAIKDKIAQARAKLQAAHDLYKDLVLNASQADPKTKFDQAHTDVQDAAKLLGDIKSDIGNLKGDFEKAQASTSATKTEATPATTTTTP